MLRFIIVVFLFALRFNLHFYSLINSQSAAQSSFVSFRLRIWILHANLNLNNTFWLLVQPPHNSKIIYDYLNFLISDFRLVFNCFTLCIFLCLINGVFCCCCSVVFITWRRFFMSSDYLCSVWRSKWFVFVCFCRGLLLFFY